MRDLLPTFAVARQPKTAESGQSVMEFAVMLPFMILLLLGVVEIGRAVYLHIEVANAATAGVEYGSQNEVKASDIAGMQDAAVCDANSQPGPPGSPCTGGILTPADATATHGCFCQVTGSGTRSGQGCDPAQWLPCATISCGGDVVVECVQVTTQASFNSLFNYPLLPSSFTAHGNAIMRVRR
ncbi:MAG: TadE family protein [Candidatus Korobacteraceae bacterium]|jgi:TadE-like protein